MNVSEQGIIVYVSVCTLWLPIHPRGERLSSSLDSKVREMTDFFPPSSNNDLSLLSSVVPLYGEDSEVGNCACL